MVVSTAGSWLYRKTGLAAGARIPGLVGGEFDAVNANVPTPSSVEILAHSPMISCPRGTHFGDVTYYTTASGAGVIDVGSTGWISLIDCSPAVPGGRCDARVVQMTENVWSLFGNGPAGRARPSTPNLRRFGITLQDPIQV
jgi:hypothetical protein